MSKPKPDFLKSTLPTKPKPILLSVYPCCLYGPEDGVLFLKRSIDWFFKHTFIYLLF